MAGLPWIRVYAELPDDERSLLLARKLRKQGAYLHMVALRLWMAKKAPDGIIGGPSAGDLVEEAAAWDGPPGAFVEAAVAVGFLVAVDAPRRGYVDVSWEDEQAAHVAKIKRDRERAASRRESAGPSHGRGDAPGATSPRPDGDRPSTVETTSPSSRGDVHATVETTSTRPSHDRPATESRELRVESRDARDEKDLPLRGQGELAVVADAVGRRGRVGHVAEEAKEPTGGPVNQLRHQHAAVWAGAGRTVPLALPVKRNVKGGENPVDFSREGQLWNQAIAHARVAGATDDAAAVALVLERLKHAAHLLKSVNEDGEWVSRPKVLTLAEFVAAFHEAAEDPRDRRGQPSIHSTAVSDWSAEREKHGEGVRTPSDAEIVAAMERARKAGAR